MAVAGSLKTLGWPLTMDTPVLGRGPFKTADEVSSQLVAQKPRPGPTGKGNPLLQRVKPENCQPPTMAFAQRLIPEPDALPFHKGRAVSHLALIWRASSQSDV